MEFIRPKELPPIATFRIMNMKGNVEDETRGPLDVTDEQALEWYKNMLTGKYDHIGQNIPLLNVAVISQRTGHDHV